MHANPIWGRVHAQLAAYGPGLAKAVSNENRKPDRRARPAPDLPAEGCCSLELFVGCSPSSRQSGGSRAPVSHDTTISWLSC
jgi:hypothetical protein